MKIGIVTPTYHPYPGGVPEHVYHSCLELGHCGHDVRVITTTFGPGDAPNEEQVIRIGRSISVPANGSMCPVAIDVRMRGKVRRVLDRERFDVVHIHEPLMPTLCLSVLSAADVPLVGTFHANNEAALGYRLFRPILSSYMRRLSARIAVSEAARDSVRRHFGGEYTIIPNGVDVQRFAGASPIESYRDGSFNILFVGRLEPRKGAKHLLRAFPRILEEVPDARLIVVGGGPLANYYVSQLPPGCGGRVVFTGRVSGESLARHFATADVFCSPATGGESFGIVLTEAMSAGAPIVASRIAGYTAVVRDGDTALLVSPGSHQEIAEAVIRLARDPGLAHRLAESARSEVRQYAWDTVTERVLDVYESVVGARTDHSGRPRAGNDAEEQEEAVASGAIV
jgi:phosphatidyl-myo-inositol alpha-mannosyltransferase